MMNDNGLIPIQNIFYMLAYAYRELRKDAYQKLQYEHFDNATELLTEILLICIKIQLKKGLNRTYLEANEELTTVRGRINFQESINRGSIDRRKLFCTHDTLSENSYINQIIKTTLTYLLTQEIKSEQKHDIRKALYYYHDIDTLNPKQINWNVRFNRNNSSYELQLYICHLIIEQMIMANGNVGKPIKSFTSQQELSALYERFVREYYRQEHPEVEVSATQISWATTSNSASILPSMHTDITLRKNDSVLIIDTKFYAHPLNNAGMHGYGTTTLNSSHLYQIFSYVTNMHAQYCNKNISGMLLYAEPSQTSFNESFVINNHEYRARTLNLNRCFSDIKRDLDDIVYNWLNNKAFYAEA